MIGRDTREERDGAYRARLTVDTWLVLRQALLGALPDKDVPGALRPAALGLPADHVVAGADRTRAWERLVELGIATTPPCHDDLSTAVPVAAAGLKLLITAPIRTVAHSWSGSTGTLQVMAWDGDNAIGVTRRMRQSAGRIEPVDGGDVELELAWLPDSSPVEEMVRKLPPAPSAEAGNGFDASDATIIGWEARYSVSGTDGPASSSTPLGDVAADGLAQLGSLGTDYDAGAQVTILRTAPVPFAEAAARPVFTGVWVWSTPAPADSAEHPLLPRLGAALAMALYPQD